VGKAHGANYVFDYTFPKPLVEPKTKPADEWELVPGRQTEKHQSCRHVILVFTFNGASPSGGDRGQGDNAEAGKHRTHALLR